MTDFESRVADWLDVSIARDRILASARQTPVETVSTFDALGRGLAEDVVARWPLPPWDNSAMDGYAVHGDDILGASQSDPRELAVVGRVLAGESFSGTLQPGHGNFTTIEHLVRSSQPASADGILVDLGAYPALIPGHGRVKGVLLELEEGALSVTDRIEGYDGNRGRNLYVRKKAIIRLDAGGEVTAWVYEYAHPEQIADRPKVSGESSGDPPVYEWP